MPNDELLELTDLALDEDIRRLRADIDVLRIEAGGAADTAADHEDMARLGSEQGRRRTEALVRNLQSGPTVDRDDSPGATTPIQNIERHNLRRMNLRQWAEQLGIPFHLPPGTDLSDEETWLEIQTDYYSFEIYLQELEERQARTSGALAGMDSTDRVIEAFRRAIDSGRLDDAVIDALSQLLSPETLKWLPLIIGLGAGLGMLGGGWALLAGLILAFGPAVYDFGRAIYAIVNAEKDEEYNAGVELLIRAIGNAGADLIITLSTFALGKGFRLLRNRRRPPGSTPDTPPRHAGDAAACRSAQRACHAARRPAGETALASGTARQWRGPVAGCCQRRTGWRVDPTAATLQSRRCAGRSDAAARTPLRRSRPRPPGRDEPRRPYHDRSRDQQRRRADERGETRAGPSHGAAREPPARGAGGAGRAHRAVARILPHHQDAR